MRNFLRLLAIFCLCASSCSFVHRNTLGLVWSDKADTPSQGTAPEPLQVHPDSQSSEVVRIETEQDREDPGLVEIIWRIPPQPVSEFVIKWGYSKEELSNEIRLSAAEAEKTLDPLYGNVHRYLLADIPIDRSVFVSIASKAKDGQSLSEFSEVRELTSTH